MMSRSLKIALAASVAVNIFAVASGAALWISRKQVTDRVSESCQVVKREPMAKLVANISPAQRERVMESLRSKAIEARPDFEDARRSRHAAIDRTGEADFNPVEVAALLERSRASEMRGRAHLEVNAVEILSSLSAEDRKAMAPILSRHGSRGNKSGKPRLEAPKDLRPGDSEAEPGVAP